MDHLTDSQRAHLDRVAQDLDRLNASIRSAVTSGLTIELSRAERHHCGSGCWGDIMRPEVRSRR